MTFYPPKVNERFLNPNNAGEIEKPSAVGANGSFVCGAALKIFLQIENGEIINAKFKAAGCGFLFAAADAVCEQIKNQEFAVTGKNIRLTLQERAKIEKKQKPDLTLHRTLFEIDFDNDFPDTRQHCLILTLETLRAAINNYRVAKLASWNGDEALICTCFGVSENTIEEAIAKNSLTTVEEVTRCCRAGGGCGSCQPLILDILDNAWNEMR